ncbi:MAG: hypothetical protein QNJ48_00790 [Desulfobacterales bacterium]|nr:hypothetical protein [Desulfobacterales bacterium]MDJ0882659.1 hypothetical protein [Desulfobacterales bacterium]
MARLQTDNDDTLRPNEPHQFFHCFRGRMAGLENTGCQNAIEFVVGQGCEWTQWHLQPKFINLFGVRLPQHPQRGIQPHQVIIPADPERMPQQAAAGTGIKQKGAAVSDVALDLIRHSGRKAITITMHVGIIPRRPGIIAEGKHCG